MTTDLGPRLPTHGRLRYTETPSPIGALLLLSDGDRLVGLSMQEGRYPLRIDPSWRRDEAPFDAVQSQLDEYFGGERTAFDVPLGFEGSAFQLEVWHALCEIPYGTTTSYGAIADRLGKSGAARAVGVANGQNPIAVIVPCHRVIGADGSLTGYGGGLERKRFLLALEGRVEPAVVAQPALDGLAGF
jgi:methylated-DNA-[protein]-cysteine S-methyltransferase